MTNASITPNKYLSKDEQQELGRALARYRFSNLRDTTLILFMLKTGSRPQETLNVQWKDINFRQKSVFIDTMKGGPPRGVPLTSELCNRLLALAPKTIDEAHGPIFKIGYRQFVRIWNEYRPVEKKLHSLRHTFAVNLFEASGSNLGIVQRALGHANVHTTSAYLQMVHSIDEMREFIK